LKKNIPMNVIYCFLLSLIISPITLAQSNTDKHSHNLHLVELKDKSTSAFSLFLPQEYLSHRALERRINQGVLIDTLDLPVSIPYIKTVAKLAPIQGKSRWLNALAVHTESKKILKEIEALPFVKSVQSLGKFRKAKVGKMYSKRPEIDSSKHQESYYGLAETQISMLGGEKLQQLGYTGKKVQIAVVDGGFRNMYRMAVFDSLFLEQRILGTHDFVDGDDFVYESSVHGTNVLSIMAAKKSHLMVGTAPDASYYLFKTEDVRGEFRAEEFYWVLALEYADSVGVDVVNSSMGYTRFRDESMSYQYKDLDGKSTLISKAATIASAKGILIVNAAGNTGHKDWHYLAAPADVAEVLTVAAVKRDSSRAEFSSWGPTSDGRIKPDIAALGENTAYASMIKYDVGYGDGTSYACPVITGMVAALKQAFPKTPNKALKAAIFKSATQATQADSSLGYGIPNFFQAYLSLVDSSVFIHQLGKVDHPQKIVDNSIHVYIEASQKAAIELTVYNLFGKELYYHKEELQANIINKVSLHNFRKYKKGVYALKIKTGGKTHWVELVK
jgi:serine protease AprX